MMTRSTKMHAGWRVVVVLATVIAATLSVAFPSSSSVGASDAVKAFVPITPTRILDTRQSGQGGPFVHGQTCSLQVTGTSAVPMGAVAVAMNVTVTQPSGTGYVTVWQSDKSQPNTSNLNFVAGEDVPNLVTIGVSGAGQISIYDYLYAETGTVHVIVDVVGWYQAGFNPVAPSRVMDTRTGVGGFKLCARRDPRASDPRSRKSSKSSDWGGGAERHVGEPNRHRWLCHDLADRPTAAERVELEFRARRDRRERRDRWRRFRWQDLDLQLLGHYRCARAMSPGGSPSGMTPSLRFGLSTLRRPDK